MIQTVEQILESGQVDDSMDTESLELAQELIIQTTNLLQEGRWGQAGKDAIKRYNALLEQIQQVLNKRHGVDGMTPLTK